MKLRLLILFISSCVLVSSCASNRKLAKKKKHYMERTYHTMKTTLNNADVALISDTVKIIFRRPVMFEFAKAEINPALYPSFDTFAQVLTKFKKTSILISGYTDSIGKDQNNTALSLRRADSAKNMLIYYKIAPKRIFTWGLSTREPVASNATEAGRALNRRIEFVILYDYKVEKK